MSVSQLAIRIVLYNGTLVVANASNAYSDLFNALLGGGAGSFGVVTGFTVKTYPEPKFVSRVSRW